MPSKRTLGPTTVPVVLSVPESESLVERTLREVRNTVERRAYELAQYRNFYPGGEVDDWYRAESELLRFVPIEIIDEEKDLKVIAETPGFNVNDIEIHVEPRRLLIRGETEQTHESANGGIAYSERQGQQMFRVVNLPTQVDSDQARATVTNGVLQVTLPKAEINKSKRVQVKAA